MKKHNFLAIILLNTLFFATFQFFALTVFAETEGLFRYSVTNGNATITGSSSTNMHSPSGAVTIPSSIGGYPVKTIGKGAFYYKTQITSVVIPNSVTTIKHGAFESCFSLTSVTIPNSVTAIESTAFKGCPLSSVKIPNSVTQILDSTFYQCSSLSYVVIPTSVTFVEDFAFYGCSGIKDVYYTGTEQQKARINIENNYNYNKYFINANWHYNCNPSDPTCTHTNTQVKNSVAATCTSGGYTGDTYCKRCGIKLATGKTTSALGHNYKTAVTPSTCTEKGYTTYTCSRCYNSYKANYTDALGHDYISAVVPPSCTEDGCTTHICSRCEDRYESDHSDALGHIYGDTGDERFTCKRCGLEDSEKKSKAVKADIEDFEDYKSVLQAAADTLAEKYDDENCKEIIEDAKSNIRSLVYDESKTLSENEEIAKAILADLEKILESQYFSVKHILGDADGDGEITILDATIIQRYLAMYTVNNPEIVMICGDADGDGEITILDATMIQRYLAAYSTNTNIGEEIEY